MRGRPRNTDTKIDIEKLGQTLHLDKEVSNKFDLFMKERNIEIGTTMILISSWIIQNKFQIEPKKKRERKIYHYRMSRAFDKVITERALEAEISKNEFLSKAIETMLLNQ